MILAVIPLLGYSRADTRTFGHFRKKGKGKPQAQGRSLTCAKTGRKFRVIWAWLDLTLSNYRQRPQGLSI